MGDQSVQFSTSRSAPLDGASVFSFDYLQRLTADGHRLKRLVSRPEREALQVRWRYLLTCSSLSSAQAMEMSMLSGLLAPRRSQRD